ncbi:hypothetical protein ACLOAV_009944 [Pseudogymnoascus australis]
MLVSAGFLDDLKSGAGELSALSAALKGVFSRTWSSGEAITGESLAFIVGITVQFKKQGSCHIVTAVSTEDDSSYTLGTEVIDTAVLVQELVNTIEEPAALLALPTQQEPDANLSDAALAKSILVVEDNRIHQAILLKLLKGFGFTIIDAGPLAYGLILMDYNMPVMAGVEATKLIRKMGLDVPIMAMTVHIMMRDQELFLTQGFNDYLSKPVRKTKLQEALVKWLDREA